MNQQILLSTALLCGIATECFGQKPIKPNVIIILTDDQGYGDFSCNGNPVLSTPNIDKLHNQSIRFSNFHVAPVSTPTRGQLMTGLDAMHNKACMVPNGRNLMRRDVVTMPEIFSQNGYKTGIFGKWHLGDTYPDRPMDRGFDKCVWFNGWGLPSEIEFDNDYYNTRYLDSLTSKISNEYCTNLWFEQAIKWMGEMNSKNQPFFTYLATNAPHGPVYALKADSALYGGKVQGSQASFFGAITNIDNNIAFLDKWLEEKKLKENTIVILMNDNGGTTGVKIYNAGMKDKKGSNYDGGHRAACFVRWPQGNIGKPRTIDYPSTVQDILPTLIDLLGLQVKKGTEFDGISLKTVMKQEDKQFKDRMFVVQYGGRNLPDKYYSCVVWDSWRLVGENELYDLSNDPGQEKNIAENNPEILKKLQSFYENWWKGIEPGLNDLVPIIVGNEKSNPVLITSNNWVGADADNQKTVANASGPPRGGTIAVDIQSEGKYTFELSRWPFRLNRNMTITGPDKTIGGNPIEPGKALPIVFGCVSLNNDLPVIQNKEPDATAITIEMNLSKGRKTLQAWFKDAKGKDICGAYYVKITKQ